MSKKVNSKKSETIAIYGDKLKASLPDEYTASAISEKILGRCKAYLYSCTKTGRMREDDLDKLCFIFKLDKNDFIVKEEPKVEEEEVVEENPTVTDSNLANKLDAMLALMNELNKSITSLITVEINSQKRLDNLETTMSNFGTTIKEIKDLIDISLESIDEEVAKTNSNLNIIKGRLGDMCTAPELKKAV